jgi:branched-chain amino acid transport system permease protein
MTDIILLALYSGLLTGGLYAMTALGLSLVFGAMKIANLAHGELILLAAYVAFTVESSLRWSPLAALPFAMVVVCASSLALQFLVGRLIKDRELASLLLTYGIGIIITNLILMIWGADVRSSGSDWLADAASLGPFISTRGELLALGINVVLTIMLWWWLSRSWHGRAVRAASSNPEAAKLMGINPRMVDALSFVVAGALASVAGVALYITSVIQPHLGGALTVKAFIITVLAGVGSIPGLVVAAVLLGVTEALTVALGGSALRELTGMVLFLLVLLLLPGGLFGRMHRRGG